MYKIQTRNFRLQNLLQLVLSSEAQNPGFTEHYRATSSGQLAVFRANNNGNSFVRCDIVILRLMAY